MRSSTYFALAVLLLAIVTIILSLRMTDFKAQLLPLAVGIGLALSAIARIVAELRERGTREGVATKPGSSSVMVKSILTSGAWLISFFVMIYLIGFSLAIVLFVTSYLKVHHRGWIQSAALGLLAGGFVYAVFDYALGLDLHQGVLLVSLFGLRP